MTSSRPVDNVVITTKGLQDRNIHVLDGTTVENKGKLNLHEVGSSVGWGCICPDERDVMKLIMELCPRVKMWQLMFH